MTERRHFNRILLSWPIRLSHGQQSWDTQLIDLCLKGALVQLPETFPEHAPSPMLLHLHIPQSKLDIDMDVFESYRNGSKLGLSCTRIDLDSITHLRRLIELNIGNDDLLHRELEQLAELEEHD